MFTNILYGNKKESVHALRYIHGNIVVMESKKYYIFWVCVYSLSNPAYKVYAPHCIIICGLSGSAIFFYIIS